ncbi:MAG: YkgJ family cysteine cluster protein [Planctomycetota bacterium]
MSRPPKEVERARTDRAESAAPWYAGGLRFECTECGNCCTGPPGTVWFTRAEARDMAAALGLPTAAFYKKHAHKVDGRWSLRERRSEQGYDCVFLDRESAPGKALCSVYQARPAQCRTWPFWPENLTSKQTWDTVKRRTPCPGMDAGPLIPVERIRVLRDETSDG